MIANTLIDYIPKTKYFYSVAHQQPFYLMANQILKATGYDKSFSKLSPMTIPNSLTALKLDTPKLFSLLSTNNKKTLICTTWKAKSLPQDKAPLTRKQRCLNQSLTCNKLNTFRNHGLDFDYSMVILPGIVTARLQGTQSHLWNLFKTVGLLAWITDW
jgi:hypothetical protein